MRRRFNAMSESRAEASAYLMQVKVRVRRRHVWLDWSLFLRWLPSPASAQLGSSAGREDISKRVLSQSDRSRLPNAKQRKGRLANLLNAALGALPTSSQPARPADARRYAPAAPSRAA